MILSRFRPPHRLLSPAQTDERGQVHAASGGGERVFADDERLSLGQLALAALRKLRVQVFDDD